MRLTAVVCKWILIFMDIMQKPLKRQNSCNKNLHKQYFILCLLFSSFFFSWANFVISVNGFYQSIFVEKSDLVVELNSILKGKVGSLTNDAQIQLTNPSLHANWRKPSIIRKSGVSPTMSPSIVAEVSTDDDKSTYSDHQGINKTAFNNVNIIYCRHLKKKMLSVLKLTTAK